MGFEHTHAFAYLFEQFSIYFLKWARCTAIALKRVRTISLFPHSLYLLLGYSFKVAHEPFSLSPHIYPQLTIKPSSLHSGIHSAWPHFPCLSLDLPLCRELFVPSQSAPLTSRTRIGGGRKRPPFRCWIANCSWVSLLPPAPPPSSGRTRGALKATIHFVQCSWKQAFHTWSLSQQPRSTPSNHLIANCFRFPVKVHYASQFHGGDKVCEMKESSFFQGQCGIKYPRITGFLVVNRPWLAAAGGMRLRALFEKERCNFPCVLCQNKIKIKWYQRYPRKGSSHTHLLHWELGWEMGRDEKHLWQSRSLLVSLSGFH